MLDITDGVRENLISYLAASIEADGRLASALGFPAVAGSLETAATSLSQLAKPPAPAVVRIATISTLPR